MPTLSVLQEATTETTQIDFKAITSDALATTDLLFDILGSLNGKVDWNNINTIAEKINKKKQTATDETSLKTPPLVSLKSSKLKSAIRDFNPDAVSNETYNLLMSLTAQFDRLSSEKPADSTNAPLRDEAADTVKSYIVLNDIILAIIVKDQEIENEINQLATMLDDISKKTTLQNITSEIVNSINALRAQTPTSQQVAECRSQFKKQFELL